MLPNNNNNIKDTAPQLSCGSVPDLRSRRIQILQQRLLAPSTTTENLIHVRPSLSQANRAARMQHLLQILDEAIIITDDVDLDSRGDDDTSLNQ